MKRRIMAAAALVAGSILLALALPRTQEACSYLPGQAPCPDPYGHVAIRIGIVTVALIIAVIYLWDSYSARRSRWKPPVR